MLGSEKVLTPKCIAFILLQAVQNLFPITKSKLVDPKLFQPCKLCPEEITKQTADLDLEMVTAPRLHQDLMTKWLFLTTYRIKKQIMYLFWYVSAVSEFQ